MAKKKSRIIKGNEDGLVSITEMVRLLKSSKYFSKLPNVRTKRFVANYCTNHMNGKRAALIAGYSERSAGTYAGKLLAMPVVKNAIKEFVTIYLGRLKEVISLQIVETERLRAFYNIGDIIDSEGRLVVRNLKDLGPLQACIDGIETKIINGEKQIKVKLADKDKAIDLLSKYVELMNGPDELTINAGVLVIKPQKTKEEWKAMTDKKKVTENK